MASGKLRAALCGAGNFGVYFSAFVSEVADLIAVCDPSPTALASFQRITGLHVETFHDYRHMLDVIAVDFLVITSPNFVHKDIAVTAAERGKHVFCEKAMAVSVPECWEMARACERSGVKLMVGQKRRLRPAWARMIELREQLGGIIAATACLYYDARPYDRHGWWTQASACGGTLFVTGVHTIDWLRAACGDVTAVRAVAAPAIDPRYDFPDTTHVTLEFVSGAVASLNVSFGYPLAAFRESVGIQAVCRTGGMRLAPFRDHIDVIWQSNQDTGSVLERFADLGFEYAYRKELGDFVRWIIDGSEPCLTWSEGLRCVEIMEAANRSVIGGGMVVRLPLYPELESDGSQQDATNQRIPPMQG